MTKKYSFVFIELCEKVGTIFISKYSKERVFYLEKKATHRKIRTEFDEI